MNEKYVDYAAAVGGATIEVPVEALVPNPRQPRKVFDKEKLKALSESIRRYGILQPLTVRRNGTGSYEIIAGERRWQAARLVGFLTVPCIMMDAGEEESAALAIIENLQREDLNMFEEAAAISSLIFLYRMTQEQAAARLSVSQPYIANKLRMLRFSDEERALILENGLTERHARTLLRLRDEGARKGALLHIIKRKLNVSSSEKYVDGLLANIEDTSRSVCRQRQKYAIKDLRLFYNAIDHAAETLRGGGVPVDVEKRENEGVVTIVVSIDCKRKNECSA
ncbi:MAG: ParB/RepB/Spo0J family partition protein [Clostridia bacterium]|nr:ParB/RepB/Spo0J family partition protein [Clostridia bacterium]